jgi:hypothetical protein
MYLANWVRMQVFLEMLEDNTSDEFPRKIERGRKFED